MHSCSYSPNSLPIVHSRLFTYHIHSSPTSYFVMFVSLYIWDGKNLHGQVVIIHPQCMHAGYGSRSVCLSVTMLAATYLVYTSKTRCHKDLYGIKFFKGYTIWLLLKILRSKVLVSFTGHHCLHCALPKQKRQQWLLFNSKGVCS